MYEYRFFYVRGTQNINEALAEGWEPIPDVSPVTIPPGAVATSAVYVFLRRSKS